MVEPLPELTDAQKLQAAQQKLEVARAQIKVLRIQAEYYTAAFRRLELTKSIEALAEQGKQADADLQGLVKQIKAEAGASDACMLNDQQELVQLGMDGEELPCRSAAEATNGVKKE